MKTSEVPETCSAATSTTSAEPHMEALQSRPIRVCFLIDRLVRGGTETQLLALIRNLDRRRVKPYLVLLDGHDQLSRSLEPEDVPVLRLGIRTLRDFRTIKRAFEFARFLRRERIEILQTLFSDSSFFGIPVARLAGVPRVLRSRFNLGHASSPLERWTLRLLDLFVHGAVANCEACRQSLVRDEWIRAKRVRVIPNGVDLSRLGTIPELDPAPDPNRTVVVGIVANLRPIKDPGLLIEAARLLAPDHPNLMFEFVGEGDQKPYVELGVKYGLQDRLIFRGPVTDVSEFLARVEIATLTSRSEGMPNAVLEYMGAGRAIVATAVGGTTELLQDGVNGLLVPPGSSEDLARAIDRLVGNPEFAAQLGRAARASVSARHCPRVRANSYAQYYDQLIGRRGDPLESRPVRAQVR